MKKIIFLDIDGTLIDHKKNHRVLDSTIQAIKQARKNKHLVVLCTGRTKSNVHPLLIPFETDAQIYGAGTTIVCSDEVIYNRSIPKNDLKEMVKDFHTFGFGYTLEGEFASYCDEFCIKRRKNMAKIHGVSQETEDILSSEDTHFPMTDFDPDTAVMNKITIWSDDHEKRDAFIKKWQNKYDCIVHEKKSYDTHSATEILIKNISKASGMDFLLEHFKMKLEHTISFGDSMNDYEMIRHSHIGVCMANGTPKLKQIADLVCGPADEDSIFDTFKQLHLI